LSGSWKALDFAGMGGAFISGSMLRARGVAVEADCDEWQPGGASGEPAG
jgi:hypothetical protein